MDRIANEVHSSSTRKNREWQDKLPIVVLKAEEIIYSKANSEVCLSPPLLNLVKFHHLVITSICQLALDEFVVDILFVIGFAQDQYRDLNTLWDRVNDAIDTIIRRDKDAESGEFLHPCIEGMLLHYLLNLHCTYITGSFCIIQGTALVPLH